jgi:hypothetical protein
MKWSESNRKLSLVFATIVGGLCGYIAYIHREKWMGFLISIVDYRIEIVNKVQFGDLIIACVTVISIILTYLILNQNPRQLDIIIEDREKDKVKGMIRYFIEPLMQDIKRNKTIFNERCYKWDFRDMPAPAASNSIATNIIAIDNENTFKEILLRFELDIMNGSDDFKRFSMSFLKEHADIEEKIKDYTKKTSVFRMEFEDLVKKIFTQHFKSDHRELLKQSEIPIIDFHEDASKWIIGKLLMDEETFIGIYKEIDEKYKNYENELFNAIDNKSKRFAENIIDLSGELEKDSVDLLAELQEAKLNYMNRYNIFEHHFKDKPRPVIS